MAELIASIILGVSLSGALFIVGRKIPALLELSNNSQAASAEGHWSAVLGRMEKLLQRIPFLKQFSWQAWVEKRLSKARVLALKADNKISAYLTALHVWEEEKKNGFSANGTKPSEYWTDVKKYVKTKTGLRIKPLALKPEARIEPETKTEAAPATAQNPQNIKINANASGNDGNRKKKNKKRFHKKSRSW